MTLRYSPEVDILYIQLTDSPSVESGDLDEFTIADYAADGTIRGLEIAHASERSDLPHLKLEGVSVSA